LSDKAKAEVIGLALDEAFKGLVMHKPEGSEVWRVNPETLERSRNSDEKIEARGRTMYAEYKENSAQHSESALHRARRAIFYEKLARACNVPPDALLFSHSYWRESLKNVKENIDKIKSGPIDVAGLSYSGHSRFSIIKKEGEEEKESAGLSKSDAMKALLEYEGWVTRAIELIEKIWLVEKIAGEEDDPCEPPHCSYVME